jgi:hypothetical protein
VPPKEEKKATNHCYIKYSSNAGVISVSTSLIQTLVMHQPDETSNEILSGMSQVEFDTQAIGTSEESYETPIEQAYLTHMEEQEDAEAVEKVKRVRSKGVRVP